MCYMGKNNIFINVYVLFQLLLGISACRNVDNRIGGNHESVMSHKILSEEVYTNYRGEPMSVEDYLTIINYLDKVHFDEATHAYSGLGSALVHNAGLIDAIIDYISECSSKEKQRLLFEGLRHSLIDYAKVYCERVNGEKPTMYIGIEDKVRTSNNLDNPFEMLKSIIEFKSILKTNPDSLISIYAASSYAVIDNVLVILRNKDVFHYSENDYRAIGEYYVSCENEFGSEGIHYMLGEKMVNCSNFFNELIGLAKAQDDEYYSFGILHGIYDSLYSYGLMETDSYSFPDNDNLDEIICELLKLRSQLITTKIDHY